MPKVRINYDGMVPSLHTPKKTFLTPPTLKIKNKNYPPKDWDASGRLDRSGGDFKNKTQL